MGNTHPRIPTVSPFLSHFTLPPLRLFSMVRNNPPKLSLSLNSMLSFPCSVLTRTTPTATITRRPYATLPPCSHHAARLRARHGSLHHHSRGDGMIAQPCDQCLPAMIQGVYCHEQGCPNTGNPPPGVCLECMSYVDEQGHLPSCSDWYPTGLPEFFDPSQGDA